MKKEKIVKKIPKEKIEKSVSQISEKQNELDNFLKLSSLDELTIEKYEKFFKSWKKEIDELMKPLLYNLFLEKVIKIAHFKYLNDIDKYKKYRKELTFYNKYKIVDDEKFLEKMDVFINVVEKYMIFNKEKLRLDKNMLMIRHIFQIKSFFSNRNKSFGFKII